MSSKKGQGREQHVIPIYAFKPGDLNGSPFHSGNLELPDMQRIILGADGARMMTICTNMVYAYRALEERDIEFFELHVKDTRYRTAPTEERRTVATVTCRDMKGGKRLPVDRNQIKMSCEPLSMELHAVTLQFWDYQGGPVFQKV